MKPPLQPGKLAESRYLRMEEMPSDATFNGVDPLAWGVSDRGIWKLGSIAR